MLAIIDAYRNGLLSPKKWLPNIVSGLIVGVVALPLAMAFAIASGVKPEQGLYTAIIAGLAVGVLGGSRVQIAGPTGAFVVILASITAKYGVAGLQIATLLAGGMLLVMGLLRFGTIIKFIPAPVIVGFTSGIGVIIFVGEWKDFFGLPVNIPLTMHFHEKVIALGAALSSFDPVTTGLSCLSLIFVLFSSKVVKRLPGPLVALVTVTLLQAIFHFDTVKTIGTAFGGIPQQLPLFSLPHLSLDTLLELIGPAFTIAMLGAIESLLSASVADRMTGSRHHSNQELIGQGIANILCPLFGGFAATGAIARTATNIRNGGNSPLSAIIHSVFLLTVIVVLAPLAVNIPLCVLAAILFVVAYNMSEVHHFINIVKLAPKQDVLVLFTTFLLTIFIDLVVAVNIGVILSMSFFIYRMQQSVDIEIKILPDNGKVYMIHGPIFFGIVEKIERLMLKMSFHTGHIIFQMKHVPFMDITGMQAFIDILKKASQQTLSVYLVDVDATVIAQLEKLNVLEYIAGGRVFHSIGEVERHREGESVQSSRFPLSSDTV